MGLVDKQDKFAGMVAMLILYAQSLGYQITLGDAYRDARCPYGHKKSLHKQRLAIDLNLFLEGIYLNNTEDHRELGEYFEDIGGNWGGRWDDGNHYSLEHEGMK
jgi:hypothetical protein